MNYQQLINLLEQSSDTQPKSGIKKLLSQLAKIFSQLKDRKIDYKGIEDFANDLQTTLDSNPVSQSRLSHIKTKLTMHLKKEHGLVTKGYYQNLWMVLGMTIFGVPFGLMFGLALDNFAFFGIGLPIGMPIGMAVGMTQDKKAASEGKVLDI